MKHRDKGTIFHFTSLYSIGCMDCLVWLWSTDTPAPCRVRCPTRVRVSVRHRHDTRTTFYILDITGVHVSVSVSCPVSVSVLVLHRWYDIKPWLTWPREWFGYIWFSVWGAPNLVLWHVWLCSKVFFCCTAKIDIVLEVRFSTRCTGIHNKKIQRTKPN